MRLSTLNFQTSVPRVQMQYTCEFLCVSAYYAGGPPKIANELFHSKVNICLEAQSLQEDVSQKPQKTYCYIIFNKR